MSPGQVRQLRELACRHGVQTSYRDASGRQQTALPEALSGILAALGVPSKTPAELRESLAQSQRQNQNRCLEPVVVIWDRRPATISLHLPSRQAGKTISASVRTEDGQSRQVLALPVTGKSASGTHQITLDALPFGYHEVGVETDRGVHRALLISAPEKSYSEPDTRDWGIFVPMYAAHSKQSWGAGNFSDWQRLSDWVASAGGTISATTPLLAAFLDFPECDPSPYAPASRLFWNEFYLDIPRIPEFACCDEAQKLANSTSFQNTIRGFRKSQTVDYREEWAARRKILELLARHFFAKPTARQAEFSRFLHRRPELRDYATFRAVCEQLKKPWQDWPLRLRHGNLQAADCKPANEQFHLYIQWAAQEQMDRLVAHGHERGMKLYLDLPLGVHAAGYDVWRWQNLFALDASAGAPPDPFFSKGQNWTFAPLHPQRVREAGYRYVLDFLRFQMRHTGLLRVDHVMGMHRLYWIPRGFPAGAGVYVSYPAEELHAIFNLESHRHRTMLVGENLGTVPPEVNESMQRHGMRGMFVVPFEQRTDPEAALRAPPVRTVASLNTHDMPAFAAHWNGLDIDDRAGMQLIARKNVSREKIERRKLNAALVTFLRRSGFLKKQKPATIDALDACLQWLAKSPAEMVLASLEDLLLETKPQNVPGTHRECPNWRRKARLDLESIFQNKEVKMILESISPLRKPSAK